MNSSHPNRLAELDVLRGLAALGVMLFHYTVVYPLSYNPDEASLFKFPWGYYGLHLFFMISGFVIFMTLEKVSSPLDFIVSRFSRLFPAYWTAIFLTFFIVQNYLLFPSSLMEVSLRTVLTNLPMTQYWFNVQSVDGVYWTLEAELLFYGFMLLVLITKSTKNIEVLGTFWLLIMVLNKYCVHVYPLLVSVKFVFFHMLTYGNFFFAGILFYNIKTKGDVWYRHLGLALCLLVQYLIGKEIESFTSLIFFFIIFYLFIYGRLSFIIQKPLIWLGTISYSLYLVHSKVGFVILEQLDVYQYLGVLKINAFFKLLIPVTCSLVLAALMTYLIERPAMNWIRGAYKARHKAMAVNP